MQKLTFITGNAKKAEALALHFHMPVDHVKLDLPEIQSLELEEIAEAKAKSAFQILKSPVLVEDAALTFEAFGGLPGPFIKWFLHTMGNAGLCKILDAYENRNAVASVCFAYCDEQGVKLFTGSVKGKIGTLPKGDAGFGFDPIFIPEGYAKTWAEMEKEEGDSSSMRKQALAKLSVFLANRQA